MEGLLDCWTCGQNFDLDRRRPKLLPCGHTHCATCLRANQRNGTVTCPKDKEVFHAISELLQDDLQLLCWIEATAQGMLECVCCRDPFDRLFRRPAALNCGHAVCRACLLEANYGVNLQCKRPVSRRDSVDESWDYYQEDGSAWSSTSSLEGGSDGPEEMYVDCPVQGCGKSVGFQDHHHLLACLDGARARGRRSSRSSISNELFSKLVRLENKLEGEESLLNTVGPVLDALENINGETSLKDGNKRNSNVLMTALRWIVEHQDSPRCEQLAVFSQSSITRYPITPSITEIEAANVSYLNGEDVKAIKNLKNCKIELDVFDLAMHGPGDMHVKKEALLRSDNKVWKLTGVDCWCDPDWTRRLLERVGPDVEQLQLLYPTREHLQVVRDAMPYLRRLEVRGWQGVDLLHEPFNFHKGPARNHNTLEWLEVFLPSSTAMSLLRVHRHSLRKLRLFVSDEWGPVDSSGVQDEAELLTEEDEDEFAVVATGEDALRSHCLDDLLLACGPEDEGSLALSSVCLLWPSSAIHDSWRCRNFARALRDANLSLNVECELCPSRGPLCDE